MKKKKIFALITMTAMLGGTLAGCVNGKDGVTEGQEQVTEERPVVTIWSNWNITDIYTDQGETPYWQAIEAATGVDLQFIDSTGGADTLSILIGTNDLPDIVIETNSSLPGGIQQQLQQGNIIALNDVMEAGHMPNLSAYLKADAEVDKLCKRDDGLYPWAPMIRGADSYLIFAGNMVRQDWLDELGLEQPTTIQEMEDTLIAFKEQKGCDTGYSFAFKEYDLMVNSFGIDEGVYIGADNKVHYGVVEEGYLDFLKLFNRWYEIGILDPDAFTQEIDSYYAKMASNRTGLVFGFTGSTFNQLEAIKKEYPEMNYQPIPHPVASKGDTFAYNRSQYRVPGTVGAMISANCENVEAAAKVIDYAYGKEGMILTNFGKEGVTYEVVDGEYQFTDYMYNNPDGLSSTTALSIYAGDVNKPSIIDGKAQKLAYRQEVQKLSLDVWAATGDAKELPLLALTPEESEEYNAIYNEVKTYVDEFKLKFIFGTEPLENYPEFLTNINNMGIERAVAIQQAAYDRYLER